MKKKFSPKLFVTVSLFTLILGIVALNYLTSNQQSSTMPESADIKETGVLNSTCYEESSDPFITRVKPDCK